MTGSLNDPIIPRVRDYLHGPDGPLAESSTGKSHGATDGPSVMSSNESASGRPSVAPEWATYKGYSPINRACDRHPHLPAVGHIAATGRLMCNGCFRQFHSYGDDDRV